MFKNLHELITTLNDEQACIKYLAEQRWKDGKAVCPYCGFEKCYVIENGKRYKCASKTCFKRFHVTVGTIFHASNIPLVKWFMGMYIASAHKKGISSYQLGRDLGVTQKTAWFMLHRLRECFREKQAVLIEGLVEIDETYVGGKFKNKSKKIRKANAENQQSSVVNKTGVVGMLKREGDIRLLVMDGTPLKETVKQNVSFKSTVITDAATSYMSLKRFYAGHEVVNHFEDEFVRGQWHTNSIEGFFSQLKRGIYGIYHHVTAKHLSRYCDEFSYRYNTRKIPDAVRFNLSLTKVEGKLPYKKLVNHGKSSEENKQTKV